MDIKRIVFAGGTFACAIGIGFFMQQGEASVPELAQTQAEVPAADVITATQSQNAPQLPAIAGVVPALPPLSSVANTASLAGSASSSKDEVPARSLVELETPLTDVAPKRIEPDAILAQGCDVSMIGKDGRAAMVDVTLIAPCAANEVATIHHEGMMFSVQLDDAGTINFEMPALNENAMIIAALKGGEGAVLTHDVPTLADYDRVVVQWKGNVGFELHAREMGANYGDAGHVWHGAARDAGAISYQVGFLIRLGNVEDDAALIADIYTFPTTMSDGGGMIELSVEAEILANNCAKDITAQTIQISPFAERVVHDLEMSLPECDAVGDFVVLGMPVQDIQLASR
jgi:hypothetical protein